MKPPICEVCDDAVEGDSGGLIYFARSESDEEWYEKADEDPHFVGHPPNAAWFCAEHADIAEQYSDRTLSEALQQFKE